MPRVGLRREVSEDLRRSFNAADRPEAEAKLMTFVKKWQEKAPALAIWAEENVPEGFAVVDLGLTEAQRKKRRSTNSMENLNQQIKRRTRGWPASSRTKRPC